MGPRTLSTPIEVDQVGYIFDLKLPLDRQFELALSYAKALQRHRESQQLFDVENPRRREDKYADYLRIIDAKDLGVSHREIGDALFPHVENSHPDYARNRVVKQNWAAARRIRDGDYILLAAIAG